MLGTGCGRDLFHRAGILYAGPEDSSIMRGVSESADAHGLHVMPVDPADLAVQFGIGLKNFDRDIFTRQGQGQRKPNRPGAGDQDRQRRILIHIHTQLL